MCDVVYEVLNIRIWYFDHGEIIIIIIIIFKNDSSDTITRQQLPGHLTKSTDNVARLVLTV